MRGSAQAFITPEVAIWARERSGTSYAQLAKSLHVKPDQIAAWERGDSYPLFAKAQDLARILRIPFGYLFLSKPPKDEIPLPDLRTVEVGVPLRPTPEFLDSLNGVLVKQQWYRDYVEESRTARLGYVGRSRITDGIYRVADRMRRVLSIDAEMRKISRTWSDFLRRFIANTEDVGVLVMRSGIVGNNPRRKLSVKEFRGFAISDDLAPLVFVNGNDAIAAQSFTLAHELAHIWIGESGISNADPKQLATEQTNAIERFCNGVAAELLVPKADFMTAWGSPESIKQNVEKLARRYRVSSIVVLRRAYELEVMGRNDYFRLVEKLAEKQKQAKVAEGGSFYNTLPSRNSPKLTNAALEALRSGRLLYRDAAKMFSVRVATLSKLLERQPLE